jgi:hypothetical protein
VNSPKVDHSALKTGQALTILLLLGAFVLDSPVFVGIVAVAQLLGAVDAPFAPYRLFYRHVARRVVKPNVIADNPEPHRFAMLVGGVMNAIAVVTYLSGATVVTWALVWIVIALANLNFWLNFCVGCWMYYGLNRIGVPGFARSPIQAEGRR